MSGKISGKHEKCCKPSDIGEKVHDMDQVVRYSRILGNNEGQMQIHATQKEV